MSIYAFEGTARQLRRGGWSGKAVLIAERHGQIFETQLGPREFAARQPALDWLQQLAAERAIEDVRIIVRPMLGAASPEHEDNQLAIA